MKIKWLKDIELEVITSLDEETDSINTEKEFVRAGEIDEVDIVKMNNNSADIQFGNGSVAFGVPKDSFSIMKH